MRSAAQRLIAEERSYLFVVTKELEVSVGRTDSFEQYAPGPTPQDALAMLATRLANAGIKVVKIELRPSWKESPDDKGA